MGNARILGLEHDLGLTNLQYSQGLAVFYATYIARCVSTSRAVPNKEYSYPLRASSSNVTNVSRILIELISSIINSELPSNLVLKKITPKIWLPLLTAIWGIITMCLGFVRNFGSFFAVRAILGIAEGGLLPGIVLYLSGLYTRQEMALRIGIFYTAASLSGAFGGAYNRPVISGRE